MALIGTAEYGFKAKWVLVGKEMDVHYGDDVFLMLQIRRDFVWKRSASLRSLISSRFSS